MGASHFDCVFCKSNDMWRCVQGLNGQKIFLLLLKIDNSKWQRE